MRRRTNRLPAVAAAALILVGASLFGALGARADGGHGHDGDKQGQQGDRHRDDRDGGMLFRASLAPSVPTDPAIHGVAAGGAPWVLQHGRVAIDSEGRVRVRIAGLVIPVAHGTFPAGTARPVTVVSAALYCGADSATTAAATTASVPISEGGDAVITETVQLPATCLAPVVLIHPNNVAGAYIAASGWRH
jgi:hypothetical protein